MRWSSGYRDSDVEYGTELYPFRFRRLSGGAIVAVSESGDHTFTSDYELHRLINDPRSIDLERLAELQSKFFVGSHNASGTLRLLASRFAAKRETVLNGPSLHVFVPTLQCDHSCRYCQVSRVLEGDGHTMSHSDLARACDSVFESPSQNITIEFQGGEPLLRFDLVRFAIERIAARNRIEKRHLRFVIASTLHQLDERMCEFFREHGVYLSTSIDGTARLHNKNRPRPTRDAYERTVAGIKMARELVSPESVSALMTTTRNSLEHPEAIVDEYVTLGFRDIFLRPMSAYGFARRNASQVGYSLKKFAKFYERALEHILKLNRQGIDFKEVSASIALNKILSPFDGGFVDLQSPTGAGLGALVYNYDGFVYPSDESRMLAEMGDMSLRLGLIGTPLSELMNSATERELIRASLVRYVPGCDQCAYQSYCGPDPVNARGQLGDVFAPVHLTSHCKRSLWLFDLLFEKLETADEWFLDLAHRWASPATGQDVGYA
jgi:His-Xaa-Ser system radical SAM maturase HxsB